MDVRQAEYLKLLGIQAWCKQDNLACAEENIRLSKAAQPSLSTSLSANVFLNNQAGSGSRNSEGEHDNQVLGSRDNSLGSSSALNTQDSPPQAPIGDRDEAPNFAANSQIDPARFSRQLQGVTAGLRVDLNPKAAESIAVKSTFVPSAFRYPEDESIFAPEFAAAIESCTGCNFSQTRHKVTLARQQPTARIMVIADIPLKEEMFQGVVLDRSDESFFFQAMNAVGFKQEDLYITPFIKCRPPELQDVEDTQWQACFQVLKREILEVNPSIIFLLGRTSVKFLLQKQLPFEELRRELHMIGIEGHDYRVVISHSPKVYAKNSRLKANFWQDIKFLRQQIN